jgi:YD repeat-containing protein
VEFDASPEGHHLRWDAHGQLVGITILNARLLLEQDSKIVVTRPQMQVEASDLEGILTAA